MNLRPLILLAEDSEDDELLFMDVLKRSGFTNPVFVVRDGEEAIAYLNGDFRYGDRERFPLPSILMLDLALPKVNGWQVLQWLKGHPGFEHILVVVLTGSLRVQDLHSAYRLGARSYLSKPFTVDDLLNLENANAKYFIRPPPSAAQSTITPRKTRSRKRGSPHSATTHAARPTGSA